MTRFLAAEVLREALRDRWLHVGAASFLLLWPVTAGSARLALGGGDKAGADVGLFAVWGIACAMALVAGARTLGPRPDLVWLWTGPVSRTRVVLSRAVGAAIALAAQVTLLLLAWGLAAVLSGVDIPPGVAALGVLLWIETCIVAALAGLLTNLLPAVPAAACTVALWVVGHLAEESRALAEEGATPDLWIRSIYTLLPDLDALDVSAVVVHGGVPTLAEGGTAALYGALWCMALALATAAVVARRDLP